MVQRCTFASHHTLSTQCSLGSQGQDFQKRGTEASIITEPCRQHSVTAMWGITTYCAERHLRHPTLPCHQWVCDACLTAAGEGLPVSQYSALVINRLHMRATVALSRGPCSSFLFLVTSCAFVPKNSLSGGVLLPVLSGFYEAQSAHSHRQGISMRADPAYPSHSCSRGC